MCHLVLRHVRHFRHSANTVECTYRQDGHSVTRQWNLRLPRVHLLLTETCYVVHVWTCYVMHSPKGQRTVTLEWGEPL